MVKNYLLIIYKKLNIILKEIGVNYGRRNVVRNENSCRDY